jgi:hypothetical protein
MMSKPKDEPVAEWRTVEGPQAGAPALPGQAIRRATEDSKAPSHYTEAGLLMLIAGATNGMFAGLWLLSGFAFFLCFLLVLPGCVGAWQAYVGYRMSQGDLQQSAMAAAVTGLVSSLLNLNPIGVVVGLIVLFKLGKPEVASYLRGARS